MTAKDKNTFDTKVPLKYPVETSDGQKLSFLQLSRLSAGQLEQVSTETNRVTKSIMMLAFSTHQSAATIRLLDAADFEEASSRLVEYMGF